jgi:hypothetical protein
VAVTATLSNYEIQVNQTTASNVCLGDAFTTITGLINCEGGGMTTCVNPNPNKCGTGSGFCTNVSTDPNNCGVCGNTCVAPTTACSSGACGCPIAGQVAVGPAGAQICCPSGDIDSNGICCAAGQTACGTPLACINTASDVNNCGGCGVSCTAQTGPGSTCVAGVCHGAPPVACTQLVGGQPQGPAGQTNCVQCNAKSTSGGVCSAEEQIIVNKDISKGLLVSGQLDPVNSCFGCAISAGCVDTGTQTTKNCEDFGAATVGTGSTPGKTKTQACNDTLACIMGGPQQDGYTWSNNGNYVSCGNDPSPGDGISNCYCGPAFPTTAACNTATGTTVNGTCDQVIVDALGDTEGTTAPATVIGQITTATLAGGRADAFLKCAGTNAATPACPMCFQ